MTRNEIDLIIEAIESLNSLEFWCMEFRDFGVFFRKYAKSKQVSLRIDHKLLSNLIESYDTEGLEAEVIKDNPQLLDFIDAFFEKLHTSKMDIQIKLDGAKSMPDVTKRLQQLQNHYLNKQHWNSTIPVKPINTLTINAIRLELPQLSGVQLISTEQEALQLEDAIMKKYGQYLEFEPISGESTKNS